jgi:hypothetical protein
MQVGATAHVDRLLTELCAKLGFSEPARQPAKFAAAAAAGVDCFTDLVLSIEGLDPLLNKALRQQVREVVAKHFESWGSDRAA